MSLVVYEELLGEEVIYKETTPCLVIGFHETKIKGFDTVLALLVNVCTGECLRAELGSIKYICNKKTAGYDKTYFKQCVNESTMKEVIGTKIANVLINAGIKSMDAVCLLTDEDISKIKGIGDANAKVIKTACEEWKKKDRRNKYKIHYTPNEQNIKM